MIDLKDWETELLEMDLSQYQETVTHPQLLAIFAGALQECEQANNDLIFDRLLFRSDGAVTIEGLQLDQWGGWLGVAREGRSDAAYLAILKITLQVLRSQGSPDELIAILRDAFGVLSPLAVGYWDTPPATWSAQIPGDVWGDDADLAMEIALLAARADPAGVQVGEIISLGDTPLLFNGNQANGWSVAGGAAYGLACVDIATEAGV